MTEWRILRADFAVRIYRERRQLLPVSRENCQQIGLNQGSQYRYAASAIRRNYRPVWSSGTAAVKTMPDSG
jgi:hypothetical protein